MTYTHVRLSGTPVGRKLVRDLYIFMTDWVWVLIVNVVLSYKARLVVYNIELIYYRYIFNQRLHTYMYIIIVIIRSVLNVYLLIIYIYKYINIIFNIYIYIYIFVRYIIELCYIYKLCVRVFL
jgi:hypothetical protein